MNKSMSVRSKDLQPATALWRRYRPAEATYSFRAADVESARKWQNKTRRDLDVGRLGAMGISGGGMHTFFSACLDARIRACVVSGYYSTFSDSVLAMSHCACNFVPGLADFGEMHDLVGLIAPRPMLVEAGNYDPIFPIRAVRSSVAKARSVYDVFGARDLITTDYFEGRHQISGRKAYDFLKRELS